MISIVKILGSDGQSIQLFRLEQLRGIPLTQTVIRFAFGLFRHVLQRGS